jgi:hypothetical protein
MEMECTIMRLQSVERTEWLTNHSTGPARKAAQVW